jgi:acyl-coenzyme A synthetase/AMP-(fatty) acid ligase
VVLVPPRSLPKTTSGKLARGKAKTMFEAGEITALDT